MGTSDLLKNKDPLSPIPNKYLNATSPDKSTEKLYCIAFILVSGGHSTEALGVADTFGNEIEKSFITFRGDTTTRAKIEGKGPSIEVTRCFQEILRKNPIKQILLLPLFLYAIFEGIAALRKLAPDAVLSTGSGPAIPIMIAAKLTGRKVIYVESMARISSRSLTGIVAYHFLADQFFIQWPEQKMLYPDALFEGRVL